MQYVFILTRCSGKERNIYNNMFLQNTFYPLLSRCLNPKLIFFTSLEGNRQRYKQERGQPRQLFTSFPWLPPPAVQVFNRPQLGLLTGGEAGPVLYVPVAGGEGCSLSSWLGLSHGPVVPTQMSASTEVCADSEHGPTQLPNFLSQLFFPISFPSGSKLRVPTEGRGKEVSRQKKKSSQTKPKAFLLEIS